MKEISYPNVTNSKETMKDPILDSDFVNGFIHLCQEGYSRGWHERNGGNLSYRIKQEEIKDLIPFLKPESNWTPIGTEVPFLANEYFLVTGSGRFLGNVAIKPKDNIGIIKVDETGTKFTIIWGLENNGRPTSELPTHLMNLEVVKKRSNDQFRVVYHCHATNLIALTFTLPLNNAEFTRELWESSVECSIVFPNGIGVLPFMVPGGREIAVATSKLMEKYDAAIWAYHGLFVTGENFDNTFGLADTIEKASEILVKVISMNGRTKRQTINPEEFLDLGRDFNVSIDSNFLKERKEIA